MYNIVIITSPFIHLEFLVWSKFCIKIMIPVIVHAKKTMLHIRPNMEPKEDYFLKVEGHIDS